MLTKQVQKELNLSKEEIKIIIFDLYLTLIFLKIVLNIKKKGIKIKICFTKKIIGLQ